MGDSVLDIPIRSDKLRLRARIAEVLAHEVTPYQTIDIVRTDVFGKVLTLDNHIQLTELDECAYHEALVHIPLANVVKPERALIIGGGDGGVLREILRWPSVLRVDMVEIDRQVVEVCRRVLPEVSAGAFDDPRTNLVIGDAFAFAREASESYDLIVVDATDVYEEEEGSLSEQLFTDPFYQDCRRLLAPGGLVVTQADNHIFCPYSLEGALATFGRVFPRVGWYQAVIPSFGGFSAYAWAAVDGGVGPDAAVLSRAPSGLRYLNEATYRFAFSSLPYHSHEHSVS
jgi:spermidine synthase